MNLLLNTSLQNSIIILFDKNKIIQIKEFNSNNNNEEIIKFLSKIHLDKIEKTFICTGPWRFTSLRVGVSYIQTLSFIKQIPIHTFSTHDYFRCLSDKNTTIVQQISFNELYINGKLTEFKDLKKITTKYCGEIKTVNLLPEQCVKIELKKTDINSIKKIIKISEKKERLELIYNS